MGKSRGLRRGNIGANYLLFAAETTLGWRVVRRVSGAQGEEMLARGQWRDVYDASGNHIGYQVIASYKTDLEILSGSSSCSITAREIELNAGLRGRSRTAGMSEEQRISRRAPRTGSPLPPEDAIERAIAKVKEWPRSHRDRAVRIYPNPVKRKSGE